MVDYKKNYKLSLGVKGIAFNFPKKKIKVLNYDWSLSQFLFCFGGDHIKLS